MSCCPLLRREDRPGQRVRPGGADTVFGPASAWRRGVLFGRAASVYGVSMHAVRWHDMFRACCGMPGCVERHFAAWTVCHGCGAACHGMLKHVTVCNGMSRNMAVCRGTLKARRGMLRCCRGFGMACHGMSRRLPQCATVCDGIGHSMPRYMRWHATANDGKSRHGKSCHGMSRRFHGMERRVTVCDDLCHGIYHGMLRYVTTCDGMPHYATVDHK